MWKIIKRTVTIVDTEIFNHVINRILINAGIFLFLLALQWGDITLIVSSNYFLLIWIAVNSYFVFNLLIMSSRGTILAISRLGKPKIYLTAWGVSVIISVQWFVFLIAQIFLVFHANLLCALALALLQYVFAIALGAFLSIFWKKNIGLILIGILGIYNFFYCSPYNHEGASHEFFLNEFLFTVKDINRTSILELVLCVFFFILVSYGLLNKNMKNRQKKLVTGILIFIIADSLILGMDVLDYKKLLTCSYQILNDTGEQVEFRGVTGEQASQISEIVTLMIPEYEKFQTDPSKKVYKIDKFYLPEIIWRVEGNMPNTVEIDKNTVSVNVLSRNLIYFYQPDLLRSFLEEVNYYGKISVDHYDDTKYTRHLIDGFSIYSLSSISARITLSNAASVHSYYVDYADSMLSLPTTTFNFVKKIAYIINQKYPEDVVAVYHRVVENNPQNDEDFIKLLNTYFKSIYNDSDIQKIIDSVQV